MVVACIRVETRSPATAGCHPPAHREQSRRARRGDGRVPPAGLAVERALTDARIAVEGDRGTDFEVPARQIKAERGQVGVEVHRTQRVAPDGGRKAEVVIGGGASGEQSAAADRLGPGKARARKVGQHLQHAVVPSGRVQALLARGHAAIKVHREAAPALNRLQGLHPNRPGPNEGGVVAVADHSRAVAAERVRGGVHCARQYAKILRRAGAVPTHRAIVRSNIAAAGDELGIGADPRSDASIVTGQAGEKLAIRAGSPAARRARPPPSG